MSMGSVIRRAVEGFAAKSGKGAAKETAEKTVKETAEKTVKGTAEKTVKGTTEKTAKETAEKTAKGTAEQTAKETAEKTAKETAERTAGDAAEETAGSTGRAAGNAGKADDGLDPDMFDGSFADDAIDPVTTPEAPKGAAGGDKAAAPTEAPQPGKDGPKAGGTAAGETTAGKAAEAAGDAATAKAEAKAARRAAMAERAGQAARYAARHPKGVGMTALGVGLATPGISNLVSGGLSNLAGNAVGTIDDSVRKGVSQVRGPSQTDQQQQQQTSGAQGGGLLSKAADGISSEIGTPAGLTAAGGLAASMLSSKGSLVHTAGTAAAVLGTLAAGSQYLSGRSHAGLSTPAVDRGRQDAGRKASGAQQGRTGTPGQDYELTPDSEPLPDEPGL